MLTNFSRDLEMADNLETDYLKLLYYDLPPMSGDYRSYEYSRLCTILEGRKNVSLNDNTNFTYTPGQFILLPPHSTVHMEIDVPTKALVFELSDSLLKTVIEKISMDMDADYETLKENRFFLGNINNNLGDCISKLNYISMASRNNKEFLLDLYAQELAYHLIKIKGIQQIITLEYNHPIYKAIKYIKENINQPISISQLAYDLNMSETNFSNSFKKVMGITPRVYITNLKLTRAKEMLRNQNVSEVANDLGFGDLSYFITLFKSKYGVTPKQYQLIGNTPVKFK